MKILNIFEEQNRLEYLYKTMVFRATLLEYIIVKGGKASTKVSDFAKHHSEDHILLWKIKPEDMSREIKFLKNLRLIELEPSQMSITEKGIEFVEKGIFWDKLNSLTFQLSGIKTQRLTMLISVIAIITSLIVATLKLK